MPPAPQAGLKTGVSVWARSNMRELRFWKVALMVTLASPCQCSTEQGSTWYAWLTDPLHRFLLFLFVLSHVIAQLRTRGLVLAPAGRWGVWHVALNVQAKGFIAHCLPVHPCTKPGTQGQDLGAV
jgi:hypothetical protein